MITEHQELARQRLADELRAAQVRALRKELRPTDRQPRPGGPRHELAVVLRRLADRLEPQPRHRRTGLSAAR